MNFCDKIVCIGKNYLDHATELGDKIPKNPVIFLKPPSILREATAWNQTLSLSLPPLDNNTQYECEVVLKLKKGGSNMSYQQAQAALGYVSLGLDMTMRTIQSSLKKEGHPWTIAKVFKDSAVVGPWIAIEDFPHYMETEFSLAIDNIIKQHALPKQMLMDPINLIMYISNYFPLCENDLIFTGTPAGVDRVTSGETAKLTWGNYEYFVNWN